MKSIDDNNPSYNLDMLRHSNDIAYKWAKHFKFSSNKYLTSVIKMYKNKSFFSAKLSKNNRKLFLEDYTKMFYAIEVENEIIKQYYHVITHIIKKLKIEQSLAEYYIEIGMYTLRQSVWNYRTHEANVKFITFCYNGIHMRLRGERSKLVMYNNRKKRVLERLESDIIKKEDYNGFSNMCVFNHDVNEKIEEEEVQSLFSKAIDISNLQEDELFLLTEYMNRDYLNQNWNEIYRNKFKNTGKNGNTISRQGVHNKLMAIQRKVYLSLLRLGYNIDINKVSFKRRYNEFEVVL